MKNIKSDNPHSPFKGLPLFNPVKLAKTTDPITSHQAANGIRETVKNHERLIVACLKEFGPAIAEEIAERIDGDIQGVDVSRRMRQLVLKGLVVEDGYGVTQKGKRAIVWKSMEGKQ